MSLTLVRLLRDMHRERIAQSSVDCRAFLSVFPKLPIGMGDSTSNGNGNCVGGGVECANCGRQSIDTICNICKQQKQCPRCHHYLPTHCYQPEHEHCEVNFSTYLYNIQILLQFFALSRFVINTPIKMFSITAVTLLYTPIGFVPA